MSNRPLNLWLLNRVVGWDKQRLARALGPHVRLGWRRMKSMAPRHEPLGPEIFVNAEEESYPGELMHESHIGPGSTHTKYDEYFVPIPVKCVRHPRSPFWRQTATSPEAAARLDAIAMALDERFPDGHRTAEGDPHRADVAKDQIGEFFGDVRLNLAEPIGYYEILLRATARTKAKNVLVGYSQGGTVARYLAFLDEHIAAPGEGCIHGVITVHAPNRGSALAAPNKAPDVATAALSIVLSLLQWLSEPLPPHPIPTTSIWYFLSKAGRDADIIEFINRLLDAEMKTVGPDDKRLPVWRAARKWLSGMSGVRDLAFWDLHPELLGKPGQVLHAIEAYPLERVLHGAVVGCNDDLTNLIELLLSAQGPLGHLAGLVLRKKITALVAPATAIYRALVQSYPEPPGPAYASVARNYLEGVPAGAQRNDRQIPPSAHDFVVPTVSQLLVDRGSPAHLGNRVNPGASHLSGADGTGEVDGRSDEDLVVEMLARM